MKVLLQSELENLDVQKEHLGWGGSEKAPVGGYFGRMMEEAAEKEVRFKPNYLVAPRELGAKAECCFDLYSKSKAFKQTKPILRDIRLYLTEVRSAPQEVGDALP